ncbi:MAG: hypothetical protein TE42_10535 [Candidatus Synechococcus spongiarum SP3]|uniref:Uncharacterized protein n=1 Tax=Candidatus Synechococcus spongiarum SP3 TaxID=1604020 RepID=A0A0G2HIN8_9SYNE|nr:MAG: hypothetical protein TE42_10535 [Candidatus Synechococcus spongiarum SP3]
MAGHVQRAGRKRGRDRLYDERHDGDADAERGDRRHGLRRNGEWGGSGQPGGDGDAQLLKQQGHHGYGQQRPYQDHANGRQRQHLRDG